MPLVQSGNNEDRQVNNREHGVEKMSINNAACIVNLFLFLVHNYMCVNQEIDH